MPIFMKYDGVKGTVSSSRHAGGSNYAFGDGSVKNIGRAGGGGGPRVLVYDGSTNSGGNDGGGISVSRIALPNSSFGAVDALAPNAVVNARALFEAQKSMVTSLGVVFSISESDANKFRHTNNLRQISLALRGQISTLRFFITDGGSQTGVMVELENCLITNYSLGGHGGAASAGELFKASLVGEGKKVPVAF